MGKKVRLGFVGAGFMGQKAHLANYRDLVLEGDDIELVAICDPRIELAKLVAERHGIGKAFTSHEEMMKNCEIDALVAIQFYGNHRHLIAQLAEYGKPIITEKPLSLSVKAGEELVEIEKKHGVMHMVGYHKRSDPATMYAKDLIETWKKTGEFGKMTYIRITMPPGDWVGGVQKMLVTDEPITANVNEPLPAEFTPEVGKQYDGFVNYYIHQINMMRHLMGGNYTMDYADASGKILAVKGPDGVCGVIEMSPYENTVDWQEAMLIGFEKGYIKVELPPPLAHLQAGRVSVMKDNDPATRGTFVPMMDCRHAMMQQAMNFLAAVRGERAPMCTSAEALEDLKSARDYIQLFNKA